MHIIKITPNLLFEYQCTSGKFITLPNRIEKIDSVARIESNRNFFLPELECSSHDRLRIGRLEDTAAKQGNDLQNISLS